MHRMQMALGADTGMEEKEVVSVGSSYLVRRDLLTVGLSGDSTPSLLLRWLA